MVICMPNAVSKLLMRAASIGSPGMLLLVLAIEAVEQAQLQLLHLRATARGDSGPAPAPGRW